jgi:SAM-dependent methyltransferase
VKPPSFFDDIYRRYPEGWGCSERKSQLFRYRIYLNMISRIGPLPETALDLGCGEGYLASLLVHLGIRNVIGVDVSKIAVERARRKYPDIEFYEGSITDIPWGILGLKGAPRLVVAGEVLYYLTEEEQRAAVASIHGAIEAGAYVLVSVNLGPKPYFTADSLHELFRAFDCVETRGIYLKTFHRFVESPLWYLRSRLRRVPVIEPLCRWLLQRAPVEAISRLSRRLSAAEETIRIAMFRKPARLA